MQFLALGAATLLEHHQQRPPTVATLGEHQRRRQCARQHTRFGTGRHGRRRLQIIAEALLLVVPASDEVQRDIELVRREVTVDTQHDTPRLVEEQQCRRVLHAQRCGKLFFRSRAAPEIGHLAIAPHVDRNHVEVLPCLVGDCAVTEVVIE